VSAEAAHSLGLEPGVPVVIAGHDHISAAFAVGAVRPGLILNSMGTAETLVGTLEERALTKQDYASGLSFGLHAVPGALFWMGGASASGGSVEWLRGLLGDEREPLTYKQVLSLLEQAASDPTGILYYPYLSGSGAPWTDAAEKASFIGLRARHGKPELLKAVLEGTAYEMELRR
jgi:xylulokinase